RFRIIQKIFICSLILILSSVACSATESTTEPVPVHQEKTKEVENSPVETYRQPVGDLVPNTLNVDGIERSYLSYRPIGLSDNIPVIIQFHGGSGTSKEAYYREGNLNGVADSEGILMIYPQADISTGSVWNTLHSDEGNKVSADDFGFIEAIIDFLEEDNRIDTSRIYVAGYSNGAAMAYQIACHLNKRIAGFVVHSGNFPLEEVISNEYPCDITHETPGLIFNGTADMTRPLEGIPTYAVSVRDGAQWWADQNNSISKTTSQDGDIERTIYASEAGTEIQLFIIEGGGHDWFNFTIDGMPLDAFTWEFFANAHR
ncbi:MAG: alpha/beta hydrolase family esterase, partial [Acidimicrobiales bacterium]